jgi:hypothetical protein
VRIQDPQVSKRSSYRSSKPVAVKLWFFPLGRGGLAVFSASPSPLQVEWFNGDGCDRGDRAHDDDAHARAHGYVHDHDHDDDHCDF